MLRLIAAPIPRVPPVTKATRPESLSRALLVRSWVAVTGSSSGSGACASLLGRGRRPGEAVRPGLAAPACGPAAGSVRSAQARSEVSVPSSPAAPASWSLRALALAYRAKTRLLQLLSDRARARGWTTAALGYPGYAAGGRARVRGRLLLAPTGTDPGARSDVPGWRRLTLEQPHGEI